MMDRPDDEAFLSCLFGSEPITQEFSGMRPFLSCLFGSEQHVLCYAPTRSFLSCLFGSEPLGY